MSNGWASAGPDGISPRLPICYLGAGKDIRAQDVQLGTSTRGKKTLGRRIPSLHPQGWDIVWRQIIAAGQSSLNLPVTSVKHICFVPLCLQNIQHCYHIAATRSGTDMPSTWRGQASCRKSPWATWTAHQVSPEIPFFAGLIPTASLLELRGTFETEETQATPIIATFSTGAISTVLKHLSGLPSLWPLIKHCNLGPWG